MLFLKRGILGFRKVDMRLNSGAAFGAHAQKFFLSI
jgi:hypothetical protein